MDGAKSGIKPYRLGAFVDGRGWVEHRYGRVWERKASETGKPRIVAAPDDRQIDLILDLARLLQPPLRILYVLLVPRDDGQDEGRFEMTRALDYSELEAFLRRYRELFECDGRHHLWIASPDLDATIVYDQHNVLYLYGDLDAYASRLNDWGLREGQVEFPSPHSHHYHAELDDTVDEMLHRYEWRWFPLDARTD